MMMNLRDYQQKAIDLLYEWFNKNHTGNPCLVMPTGSGKSHVIAALCQDAIQNWPDTTILMLTHVQELIEQNAEKMLQHWSDAPLGVYSAGLKRKEIGNNITFAGIQSIVRNLAALSKIDLVIVDECHLISHKNEGMYRELINHLLAINPAMRVIGLTATPYRLGHGLITEGDALFNALIEPVSIEQLIARGFLAPLKSKITDLTYDTSGVKKRGGEFIESELQAAVNQPMSNEQAVAETIRLSSGKNSWLFSSEKNSWLFFCTGVDHAEAIADILKSSGIRAECLTGKTSVDDRERILSDFKSGKIQAVTNANILTTGFDHPGINLIVFLRPTLSPTLYVQMAGRGMRASPDKEYCLVLDFAGVVQTHGPITDVVPPSKSKGKSKEISVTKSCPKCKEIILRRLLQCPECGHKFEIEKAEKIHELHNDDIMWTEKTKVLDVRSWKWRVQKSQKTGIEMLVASYYGCLSDPPVREYFTVLHEGYAGERARRELFSLKVGNETKAKIKSCACLSDIAEVMDKATPPKQVTYERNGKFFNLKSRMF
jgi:DNA repair protein RadD